MAPRPGFTPWATLPEIIPADLFERLVTEIRARCAKTAQLLLACYRRDNNAVPAEYVLQPRQAPFDEPTKWHDEVEPQILSALADAARTLGLDAETTHLGLGLSATHQEILHGALNVPDARSHVHAFVRTIHDGTGRPPHPHFMDLRPAGTEDPLAKARRDQLRGDLENKLGRLDAEGSNVHSYTVGWREQGNFTDADLKTFQKNVFTALKSIIEAQVQDLESTPPERQEEHAHQDFGAERRRGFRGRIQPLGRIADYLDRGTGKPLVVLGPAGSGKSALMAEAAVRGRRQHSQAVIIERYIGASPNSSDVTVLLRNLVTILRTEYPPGAANGQLKPFPPDEEIPFDLPSILGAIGEALEHATEVKPLFLFLDALDQLSSSHQAQQLHWVPWNLPAHVRLILSTTSVPHVASSAPGSTGGDQVPSEPVAYRAQALQALARRTSPADRVTLEPLERAHAEVLLDQWLGAEHRTLQARQKAALLTAFEREGNPLWLRAAAAETARAVDWQVLRDFPPDTPGLMKQMLEDLSADENHGRVLVERALSYLACARHGLAEDEMLDLLSRDSEVMDDFRRRSPKSPPVDRLPVAVWVALQGDLSPYLTEHQAQHAILLSFYHRSFMETIQTAFLDTAEARRAAHQRLADYFSEVDWFLSPIAGSGKDRRPANLTDPPNQRKASELPWHLFRVADATDPGRTEPTAWDAPANVLCDMFFLGASP